MVRNPRKSDRIRLLPNYGLTEKEYVDTSTNPIGHMGRLSMVCFLESGSGFFLGCLSLQKYVRSRMRGWVVVYFPCVPGRQKAYYGSDETEEPQVGCTLEYNRNTHSCFKRFFVISSGSLLAPNSSARQGR